MSASGKGADLPAIWIDGRRAPSEGPHVSALDRGLTLADGLFETMRVSHGTVFRLDAHLARLGRGLAALGIRAPARLREEVLEAVREAGADDAAVRLTVTRGIGEGGVRVSAGSRPTLVIVVSPVPEFPRAIFEVGLTAHVASGRRNERAMTAGLKTLAYTDAVAALVEAARAGAGEALFLDTNGHCSEASSSNLFVWTGGRLLTPPVSCGALPGITRAVVLELAGALDVPVEERAFGPDELIGAHEAFLTSSLRGLAPLVRVGDRPVGDGTPGEMTRRFSREYAALVDRECRV